VVVKEHIMIRQQGFRAKFKSRQQGAVVIIVAICLVVLIGMLGLVLDLGHLYVTKTELQNAADAAALSGAKELDGTADGIDRAVVWANAAGEKHKYNLSSTPVEVEDADIQFSCLPNGPWNSILSAKGSSLSPCLPGPEDKYFIKVSSASGSMATWFIHVLPGAFNSISTQAMAVAGRFITPVVPLGVCALDPNNSEKWVTYNSDDSYEYKLEYGFAYGVNYDFGKVNKSIGGLTSGDPLYLHPTAKTVEECVPNQNNAGFPVSFMCKGGSTINSKGYAFANTGWGGQDSYDALNTRFTYSSTLDKYDLSASICKPDTNIKEFTSGTAAGWMTSSSPTEPSVIYRLADWLTTRTGDLDVIKNDKESQPNSSDTMGGCSQSGGGPGGDSDCTDNYGVLWSYARPVNKQGTKISTSDWNTGSVNKSLYPYGPVAHDYPTIGYVSSELNLQASPYAQGLTNGAGDDYYEAGNGGEIGRRVLNVAIIDCKNVVKEPGCDAVPVVGVGKFFMQSKADFSKKNASGEFAGLISDALLTPEIRLYR
jgi:hypothetical protein